MINIFFFVFNNSQLTVILSFSNSMYRNDENLTTALGTVNTILNILLYPFLIGLAAAVEILGSQAYGARKYYVFGCFMNKARMCAYSIIVLIGILISLFHEKLFATWDLPKNIRSLGAEIIFLRMFSTIMEFETYLILRYIQIKDKGVQGIWILTFNGVSLPLFCYIYITQLDLYATGCGLVYLTNNMAIVVTLWVFVYFFCFDGRMLFKINRDIFKHMLPFIKIATPLILLSLVDIFSTETMSILANYFSKSFYSAYINAYSLYNLIGTLSVAFNISTNIMISTSIGHENGDNTRRMFKYLVFMACSIGGLVCLFLYLLKYRIITLVVEPGEIFDLTSDMFTLGVICNFLDIVTYVLISTMKATGAVYLCFIIYTFSQFANIFFIYFFAFETSMKIYGIFFGYLVFDLLLLALYTIYFLYFVDFDKSALEVHENIEEYKYDHCDKEMSKDN